MSGYLAHAVVCPEPGEIEIRQLGIGDLEANDVLIRSTCSGVSTGTDKWVMQGRFTWIEAPFPVVPGYQRVGTVEAIGSEVTTVEIGQHVVATASRSFLGASPGWGGHTSLAASDAGEVFDATGIPPERASLFVSGQVGFNAASRIQADPGSRVVVVGDGIIGVSGALAAVARGFEVLLVGRHQERMAPLSSYSIRSVDSRSDAHEAVVDWEPAAVIDTVQSDESFELYIDALPSRSGSVVFSGHTPDGVNTWGDMTRLQQRELTAHFVSGWTRERIEGTLQLMRDGAMPLEEMAGPSADSESSILATMRSVAAGRLGPVAAIVDWTKLGA